jgi:uncharacterized protein (TIGR02246 family)
MRKIVLAIVSWALVAGACQPAGTDLTEQERAVIADSVEQLAIRLLESYDALDADRFLSFYSDDMRWGARGDFQSRADFDAGVRGWLASLSGSVNVWDERVVRVLGPDAAVLEARCHEIEVDTAGVSLEDSYAMTLVWARIDGEWKVVHAHSSHPRPRPGGE